MHKRRGERGGIEKSLSTVASKREKREKGFIGPPKQRGYGESALSASIVRAKVAGISFSHHALRFIREEEGSSSVPLNRVH